MENKVGDTFQANCPICESISDFEIIDISEDDQTIVTGYCLACNYSREYYVQVIYEKNNTKSYRLREIFNDFPVKKSANGLTEPT